MSHTFANVVLHVIFSTRDRRPLIDDAFRPQLFQYMGGIARNSKVGEVERYILRQGEHHKTIVFEEEFMQFLERHGVQFDPGKIWD